MLYLYLQLYSCIYSYTSISKYNNMTIRVAGHTNIN